MDSKIAKPIPEQPRPGLTLLQKWYDDPTTMPAYANMLTIAVHEFEYMSVTMRCDIDEKHRNILGIVHGGLTASLIDEATGCSVITMLAEGERCATIDLNIKYLKAIPISIGTVYAQAKLIHTSKRIYTLDAYVKDGAGTLYAHGVGSFYVTANKPKPL